MNLGVIGSYISGTRFETRKPAMGRETKTWNLGTATVYFFLMVPWITFLWANLVYNPVTCKNKVYLLFHLVFQYFHPALFHCVRNTSSELSLALSISQALILDKTGLCSLHDHLYLYNLVVPFLYLNSPPHQTSPLFLCSSRSLITKFLCLQHFLHHLSLLKLFLEDFTSPEIF